MCIIKSKPVEQKRKNSVERKLSKDGEEEEKEIKNDLINTDKKKVKNKSKRSKKNKGKEQDGL